MKLREWDWDAQQYVEVDYPDTVVVGFMNWLRQTKAWHDNLELVHRKLQDVNKAFAAHRQQVIEAELVPQPKRSRREVALANLAKAHAMQASMADLPSGDE